MAISSCLPGNINEQINDEGRFVTLLFLYIISIHIHTLTSDQLAYHMQKRLSKLVELPHFLIRTQPAALNNNRYRAGNG